MAEISSFTMNFTIKLTLSLHRAVNDNYSINSLIQNNLIRKNEHVIIWAIRKKTMILGISLYELVRLMSYLIALMGRDSKLKQTSTGGRAIEMIQPPFKCLLWVHKRLESVCLVTRAARRGHSSFGRSSCRFKSGPWIAYFSQCQLVDEGLRNSGAFFISLSWLEPDRTEEIHMWSWLSPSWHSL